MSEPSRNSEGFEHHSARYRLYRLCGERQLDLVAEATDPESLGVAIVTLAREGEFIDCPAIGIMDSEGETGSKWLVKPWGADPRSASSAGRMLASVRRV